MFFHLMFYISLLRKIKIPKFYKIVSRYKVLRFLMVVNISIFYLFLVNYFLYNSNYTVGGWVITLHILLYSSLLSPKISLILIRKYEKILINTPSLNLLGGVVNHYLGLKKINGQLMLCTTQ